MRNHPVEVQKIRFCMNRKNRFILFARAARGEKQEIGRQTLGCQMRRAAVILMRRDFHVPIDGMLCAASHAAGNQPLTKVFIFVDRPSTDLTAISQGE
jgi:hypothetical protein